MKGTAVMEEQRVAAARAVAVTPPVSGARKVHQAKLPQPLRLGIAALAQQKNPTNLTPRKRPKPPPAAGSNEAPFPLQAGLRIDHIAVVFDPTCWR